MRLIAHQLVITLVVLVGVSGLIVAEELHVNPVWKSVDKIPEDLCSGITAFASLTGALAAAADGDDILLHSGRYDSTTECFPLVLDRAVTVRVASPSDKPVLVGALGDTVVEIVADGVAIRGLSIHHQGIGIFLAADSVTVVDNDIILDIDGLAIGSCGIWLAGARSATLEGNHFEGCGLCLAGPQMTGDSLDVPALSSWIQVGEDIHWFSTHSVVDNLVNGSELRYVVGVSDLTISNDVLGQLVIVGCDNIAISGLRLADSSIGIQIAHCRDVTVSNCRIDNQTVFGLYIAYSRGCRVDDIECTGVNHGIDLRACTSTAVGHCTVESAQQGIFSDAGTCNSISNSSVSSSVVGIAMYSEDSSTIQECRILGSRFGVALHSTSSSWIVANDIVASSGIGLRVDTISYAVSILRNRFNDNRTSMMIADSDLISIDQNEICGSALTGLFLSNVGHVSVIDNQFAGGVSHIKVQGAIEHIACQRNTEEGDEIACTQRP